MQVIQILPSIDYGDAVSNDSIAISNALRAHGYSSEIYVKYASPKVAHLVKSMETYKGNAENIVLYHYSLGVDEVTEFVKKLPDKKVLVYHNITPPAFLSKHDSELAQKCEKGLLDVNQLSDYFDDAIGISEFSRLELEKMGFKRTYVLPILMNLANPRSDNSADCGINDTTKILFVGRISPNKKIDDIIKVFYYYHWFINNNSRLYLVGKEQMSLYSEELKTLVNRLDLDDAVTFTGQVDDDTLKHYYNTADIFLCMSEHEGFCVPIIEAMYYQIPIIAYCSSAIPDTLKDSGVLFYRKDYQRIAEVMDLLVNDRIMRERLIKKQDARLADFDYSTTVSKLLDIIENVKKNERPVPVPRAGNPMVSIVICTYNRGPLLKRCLMSLYAQDFTNFEIIVVNGPSQDNTEAILREFGDVRVVVQQTLNGLSYARNLGINEAKGDIIAFIDDDAVAHRSWLSALVNSYKENSVGGVGGPVFDITGQWYQFKNGYVSKSARSSFINDYDHQYNNPKGPYYNYIMGANSSFRKRVLVEAGAFDENIRYYLDETDVCVRVIKNGYRIVHNPMAIVHHEMAEGHNRKSQYDVNYREIMKNVVYFTIKNFGNEFPSYTIRPLSSLKNWVSDDVLFLKQKKISVGKFFDILRKLVAGIMAGYIEGVKYRLNRKVE